MTSSRFATAIHILTLLAYMDGEAVTSDFIAGSVNTNPVVIRRLLKLLAEAGLVSSATGAAGGSRLARDPRKINLLDVYEAVETQELFAGHTQQPNLKCPVGSQIKDLLEPRFEQATAALTAALKRTNIGELVNKVKN